MSSLLTKLFTNGDGSIPFIPIIISVVLGAIIAIGYIKFMKPTFIFPETETPVIATGIPLLKPAQKKVIPVVEVTIPEVPDIELESIVLTDEEIADKQDRDEKYDVVENTIADD